MKIICIGNRYLNPDGAAMWLYDDALQQHWPEAVQWVEGGLGGLNLINHFDTSDEILILDYMPGQDNANTLPLAHLDLSWCRQYDHAHAFSYLLQSLNALNINTDTVSVMACNPQQSPEWKSEVFAAIEDVCP